ncbi:interferon-related developmental regulator 1 [Belonocnema kinseyi]|uniref:interferon-related developmental regulator 1 n=1 Tax=Belonocnema kinseyi TaxID=2817044 RepID=UPI00143D3C5A|nr:interferon-related developmental regulator 1 [Belonocnema kinseyi]
MRAAVFSLFLVGLLSSGCADETIENAEDALQKLNSIVDIPELKNVNASGLPIAEVQNLVEKKCEKNGGPSAFGNAKKGIEDMGNCLKSLVNVTQLQIEMEAAKPTGDLDEVFKKYCQKTPILKQCVLDLTTSLEPCLEPLERANKPIVLNITNSLLDFICFKEGDRIALFISAGGPECFQAKQSQVQQCLNSTYGESIESAANASSVSDMVLPLFVFNHKACSDLVRLQECVVKELETCEDPTPANIADSLFTFVRRVTPCEKLLGSSDTINTKVLAYTDSTNPNSSSTLTRSFIFSTIFPFCHHGGKRAETTSDEESINDACSETSGLSDPNILDEINDNEVDEPTQLDAFEDNLKEAIDGLTQKSAKGRTGCFQAIEKIFATKYVPDFVEDRKMTISDSVERGLKKGRGEEQSTAARLSTLLCVQLGAFDSAELVCRDLKSTLTFIANDNSASTNARSECCWALSMNQFFSGNDESDTVEINQVLTAIFAGSYLKGNGALATVSADMAALHAAAISSWTLLLSVMAPSDVYRILGSSQSRNFMPSLNRLRELLQSPHLDVRLSAGEALAVIFELGRDYCDDYEQEWALDLVDILKDLATDSNKYRAKKDRKQQRASFRDILRYVEEDIIPEMQIRFGREVLCLEGWCARTQYNACCRLLGPGINIQLSENHLLREIFHLGNRVLPMDPNQKTSKLEKTLMNAAAFKARTLIRSKNRDKRSIALSM